MKNIEADIKSRNFKNVYLIFGEEDYLVKKTSEKLKNSVVDKENALMNEEVFEGSVGVEKIIASGETAPFFSQYRLVMVYGSGLFKEGRKADSTAMAEYLKDCSKETVFVFVEEKVDKRSSLYKMVKKVGYCAEMNPPDFNELIKWIIKISKEQIESDVASYLINNIGHNMNHIEVEVQKLMDYCGQRKIEKKDIDEICTKSNEVNIFNMVDAIGNKKLDIALQIYNNMIFDGQEPISILAMISRQFRLILQCKYLSVYKKMNYRQIAMEIKQRDFIVKNCLTQGANFSVKTLMEALKDCCKCDFEIKTGVINSKLGVELIIIRYSR